MNDILSNAETIWQPHPLSKPLQKGDITETWCSKHFERTDHLWTGYKLVCLDCHPELKPAEEVSMTLTTSSPYGGRCPKCGKPTYSVGDYFLDELCQCEVGKIWKDLWLNSSEMDPEQLERERDEARQVARKLKDERDRHAKTIKQLNDLYFDAFVKSADAKAAVRLLEERLQAAWNERDALRAELNAIRMNSPETIEDGFGNSWPKYCEYCGGMMIIERPGKARCSENCWP